ncbi:M16 family metallopeptidase [Brevundimonas sp.]|jgi:zinc protease|uniref:M16 family metallopeptidase n=1 Tax=Brevundimonas sp. TaxID=1871086 RepID=UPI0037BFFEC7
MTRKSRGFGRLLLAGVAVGALTTAAPALAQTGVAPAAAFAPDVQTRGDLIPVQTFTLANGLRVVFHIDRSDPVTAVVLAAHVGSARETPGRTGFAHMFEHLFFLNSENLGPGGLDRLSARVGGNGANGSTSHDATDYLQTVPNDALEKMIWAEADKLGYFINTVTDPVLAKEKEVVKNEKRQSNDNRPYGHTDSVILNALYPKDHPYNWSVIGSLADLDAATLDDVRAFYRRWYTPNNATLVIAGDFDPVQARAWIEKYFGEIPRGPEAERALPRPAPLTADVRLVHEDNFATLPELTLAFPAVDQAHPDAAALQVLAQYLTDGKEAPLNAVLIDQKQLTSGVSAYLDAEQIAGAFMLSVRAFDGKDLDQVQAALDEAFAKFEADGVDPEALQRVKTMQEAGFYRSLGSVLGKGRMLARSDATSGDPVFLETNLARLRAVTAEDVMRVYRQYVAGRPHVATSFVPKGHPELALEGSTVAAVVEEPIVEGAEAPVDQNAGRTEVARTPSSFDRTVEPPSGPAPVVTPPTLWTASQPNGLKVSGIENAELPLASFQLSIDGGRLLDDPAKPGAAALTARLLDRGTATRTPAELENAFKALGATVSVSAGPERFVITGQTLARNLKPTLDLVTEMLVAPRWDAEELTLARAATLSDLQDARSDPNRIAQRTMDLILYGPDHVLSRNAQGSQSSVAALTMDDLKAYLARLSPDHARLRIVGDVDQAQAQAAVADLAARWTTPSTPVPSYPMPARPTRSTVYFYDVPGAKQSVLSFGYPALRRADADFYPAETLNYRLGGGGFASRLTQELREGKGYTYGVGTDFTGGRQIGDFNLYSPVRSNVTLEAATLARDILRDYGATFTAEDLDVTRSALGKSRARAFETAQAKLGVLEAIGDFGLPADYLTAEAQVIDHLTVEQIQALAARWIDTDAMIYVVVGDAATQAPRLTALGYGDPIIVNDQVTAADD